MCQSWSCGRRDRSPGSWTYSSRWRTPACFASLWTFTWQLITVVHLVQLPANNRNTYFIIISGTVPCRTYLFLTHVRVILGLWRYCTVQRKLRGAESGTYQLLHNFYFNATVTYITHVTELDRFIKTTLFWYGLVPFQPMRIIINSKPSASPSGGFRIYNDPHWNGRAPIG